MAILNYGSTIRTADGGQTTTTIVTASNIGSYAVASNATYYIGTTQNVFNRASGAQTLTGVSIDGNAATVTNGVYTTGAQTIAGTKTFSDGVVVNSAAYNTFGKPSPAGYQTVALFGSTSSGLFFTTDSAIISTGSYYNNGWIATATGGRYLNFSGTNFTFTSFSGATVGGTASFGTIAQLSDAGSFSATGDFRAPIFYDSDNTAYYINAASTSIVNSFKVYDALYFGDYTTYLSQSTPYLRITTANGYGNFGPANSSWFHMTTDRPNFYMAVGLHVNGDMFIYNTQSQLTSTSVRAPIFYDSGDTTYYLDPANSGTSMLVAGKVGVGTTSPTYLLDVQSSVNAEPYSQARFLNTNATTPFGGIIVNGASQAHIRFLVGSTTWGGAGAKQWQIRVGQAAGTDALSIYSWTTGTDVLYINNSGNVGIGTTSPNAKVESYYSSNALTFNYLATNLNNSSPIPVYAFDVTNGSTESRAIKGGIGFERWNPNGGGSLHFYNNSTNDSSNISGTRNSPGNIRMSIDYGGNIGVNTTTPDTNLQVVGHLHIGNQTTFENTGGWNKTIYLDGTYHARVRVIGSAYASGKNSQTETYLWVDNTVSPYSGLATNAGSFQISAGFTTMLNSARSPLFYDSDNTAYYIDAASTSVLNAAQITTTYTNNIAKLTNGSPIVINSGFNASLALRVYYDMNLYNTLTFTDASWNSQGAIYGSSSVVNIVAATATTTFTKYAGYSQETGSFRAPIFYDSDDTTYYLDPVSTTLSLRTRSSVVITNANAPENLAMLNIGYSGSGETRAIDIKGGWSANESKSITFNHATGSANIVAQINAQHNGPGSRLRWGKLYHSGDSSTYTMELISESTTSAYLTVAGSVRSPIFYDSNNTSYYVDPASTGYSAYFAGAIQATKIGIEDSGLDCYMEITDANPVVYGVTYGGEFIFYGDKSTPASFLYYGGATVTYTLQANSSLRAPIFYDSDNTGYYIDPSSSSNLNVVTASDFYTGGWFRSNVSGNGIYNQVTGQHFYSDSANYWNIASSAGAQGIRLRTGGYNGTVRGYFYADTNNDVGILNQDGSWRLRVVGGDYSLADGSSMRAQIFYDSNNTNYYIDAASTSVLNSLTIVGDANLELYKSQTVDMSNTTTYSTSNYYPVTISVPTEGCIIQIQNNLNSNVPSWSTHPSGFTLNLKWRTNGSGWGTTAVRRIIDQYAEVYANQTICGGITQMTNSSIEVVWLRGGGQYLFKFSRNLSATAQATTFTSNSQSVSPTSTAQNTVWNSSSGSEIKYNDQTISTTNMYTPVLYDWNNTSYYVDPASTSNFVGLTVANTITGAVSGNAGTVTINYNNDSNSTYQMLWGSGNNVYGTAGVYLNPSSDVIYANAFYDSSNTAYYLDPNNTGTSLLVAGKIGLGTTSAISMLDVRGAHASGYGIINVISTDSALIALDSTGARDHGIRLKYNGVDKWLVGMRDTNESYSFSNSSDTRLVTILQGGNVGVGTTSPLGKLHVYGLLRVGGAANQQTGIIALGNDTNVDSTYADNGIFRGGIGTLGSANYTNIGSYQGIVFNVQNAVLGSQSTRMLIDVNGNVGIGTTSPAYKLQVNGSFAATTKSFDIPHPTKENKRLVYASLEGPENGVYVRGKNKCSIIYLPDYWTGLVHEDSITVSITPIGKTKQNKIRNYSVTNIEDNMIQIFTDSEDEVYDFNYIVYAERKDVAKLVVEKENE